MLKLTAGIHCWQSIWLLVKQPIIGLVQAWFGVSKRAVGRCLVVCYMPHLTSVVALLHKNVLVMDSSVINWSTIGINVKNED